MAEVSTSRITHYWMHFLENRKRGSKFVFVVCRKVHVASDVYNYANISVLHRGVLCALFSSSYLSPHDSAPPSANDEHERI